MKKRLEMHPRADDFPGDRGRDRSSERGRVSGVETLDGYSLRARAVIVTPGTFLNGLIHIGLSSYPAGRANEPASRELSESLRRLGLKMLRLKTGTPMRLDGQTIDWDGFEAQPGDDDPVPFSFRTRRRLENKVLVPCRIYECRGRTRSSGRIWIDPLSSRGVIRGTGPSYCPSIEDKVVKFSSSRPAPVLSRARGARNVRNLCQRSVLEPALRNADRDPRRPSPGSIEAKILRPAYGIEYDAVAPTQLLPDPRNPRDQGPLSGRPDQRDIRI